MSSRRGYGAPGIFFGLHDLERREISKMKGIASIGQSLIPAGEKP
jgi:hypothetical protein